MPEQAPQDSSADIAMADVKISLSGIEFQTRVPVPKKPVPVRVILPVIRAFAGAIVHGSEQMSRQKGIVASCRAGCGACCRQLVPVAWSEAFALRRLVESMPEPRRSEIRRRFDDATRRIDQARLAEQLDDPGRHPMVELDRLSSEYFALRIPCPFLENESCSIYADRPVTCREYLVSSDPKFCADPRAATIRPLPLAAKASTALMHLDDQPGTDHSAWVPLTLALRWSDKHVEACGTPGTQLLSRFLECLGNDAGGPLSEPPEETHP